MNDAATNQTFDLSTMSDRELEELIPSIQKEIERRREQKKREAIDKVRAIAGELGMSPEGLLELAAGSKRQGRTGGGRGVVLWQHPDDTSLIYRGGKKPAWLIELERSGRKAVRVG